MEEAYCSYETSKLLKEKGFDECISEFYEGDKILYARINEGFRPSELPDIYYPHITHQMACAWLREVHNIFILVGWNPIHKEYFIRILNMTDGCTKRNIHEYAGYEEAVEAALKYILENLI